MSWPQRLLTILCAYFALATGTHLAAHEWFRATLMVAMFVSCLVGIIQDRKEGP